MTELKVQPHRYFYGQVPEQYGDLYLTESGIPSGTVVLIHGGFWRAGVGWDGPDRLTNRLASSGWNVWRIQYRCVGNGGGWPVTASDIADAISYLAVVRGIDTSALGPVVPVGHSAGGHLALWALSLADDLPEPIRMPGAISLAGVVHLRSAEKEDLGEGAVLEFLGTTSTNDPDSFDAADPSARPIASKKARLIHGAEDLPVPITQSERYVKVARAAGQDATLVTVSGDHFVVIDPTNEAAWDALLGALDEIVTSPSR